MSLIYYILLCKGFTIWIQFETMNKSQFIIDMNHSFSLCLMLFTYNTTGWFPSYLSFINQTAKAVWESLQFQTSLKVLKPSDPRGGVCSTVFHWLHDLLSTHRRATMKNIYIPSIYLEKTLLAIHPSKEMSPSSVSASLAVRCHLRCQSILQSLLSGREGLNTSRDRNDN